jgi:aspartate racemase
MYKTIGIVGGMGPAATADLMKKITDMTDADCDQEHIHLLIDSNVNIPDRTAAILHGGENPVPELLAASKRLESIGADFLIMPCNTAHWFIPALECEVGIPFLNMPAETARLLKEMDVETAAVLATDGTVQSGLYEEALRAEGISAIYPDDEQQKTVMSLVYDYIKRGILDPAQLPHDEMAAICSSLRARGATAVLLACTELPVAFDLMGLYEDDCVDPTSVLAGAAIRKAGAQLRPGVRY